MIPNASEQSEGTEEQYSLAKILGIWAAAAVPMAILGWIVAPALAPISKLIPSDGALPGLRSWRWA